MGLQRSVSRRPECGGLTGDRLQHNQSLTADHVTINAVNWRLSSLKWAIAPVQRHVCFLHSLFDYRQTQTNWLQTGVNHAGIAVPSALPPSKSLLLNKGVKRCFCLLSFWRQQEGSKTQMNMKMGAKCQTHNRTQGIWYECWIIKIWKRVRYL